MFAINQLSIVSFVPPANLSIQIVSDARFAPKFQTIYRLQFQPMVKFIALKIIIRNLLLVAAFAASPSYLNQANKRLYALWLWIEAFMLIVTDARIVICNYHLKRKDMVVTHQMGTYYVRDAIKKEYREKLMILIREREKVQESRISN